MTDTALAVLFAIGNAFTVSFLNLFVRRAKRHANAATGVLIGLLVGLPFMAGAAFCFWEPGWWNWKAWALFAASGAVGPSIARVFYFLAIHRLGVPRAIPLLSTMPIAAAAMGIIFLGERPGPAVLAGTVLVVLGCMAITSQRAGDAPWSRRDMWLPFASVAAFTLSHVWRKVGLSLVPSPVLGLTVMSAAGALCLLLFRGLLTQEQQARAGGPGGLARLRGGGAVQRWLRPAAFLRPPARGPHRGHPPRLDGALLLPCAQLDLPA